MHGVGLLTSKSATALFDNLLWKSSSSIRFRPIKSFNINASLTQYVISYFSIMKICIPLMTKVQ